MKKIYMLFLIAMVIPFGMAVNGQSGNELVPVDTTGTEYLISEDFESGAPGWSGNFEIGIPTSGPNSAVSGTRCAATVLNGNYGNNTTYNLYSPEISIPASATDVYLTFYEYLHTESCCDEVYLYFSTNGGSSWNTLIGERKGNFGGYNLQTISLDAYSGENIIFRFTLTPDYSVTYPGWYIDDFKISYAGSNDHIRDVPTLYLSTDDGLMQEDFKVEQNFSTLEPMVGEAVVASFGRDTLVIDTAYTTSEDLQFTTLCNDTIPFGYGLPVTVTYQPSEAGLVSDTLFIFSNDTASPFIVIFEGEAFDAYYEPQPELSLDGEVILPGNFANPVVVIDTTQEMGSSYMESIEFDLTNKGVHPLILSSQYLKESNSSFNIDFWESNSIDYQDTITVRINYDVEGHRRQIAAIAYEYYDYNGNLVINDHWIAGENDYAGTYLEADGPWVQETPDSLVIDFGEVIIGNSAVRNGMYLRNWGDEPLTIEFTTTDDQFSYSGENPLFLYPGRMSQEGNEGITFTPAEAGDIEGLLILNHNDTTAGAIDTVYLFGTGVVPVEPSAPAELSLFVEGEQLETGETYSYDLGAHMTENDWQEIQLKVVNTGETAGHMNLNSISNYFMWKDENGLLFNSRNNISIPAGDSLEFAVRFDPGYSYVFSQNASIYFHEQNVNTYLKLTGQGLERHNFNLRQDNSTDINEYNVYNNYNYDGWEISREFIYTNLHTSQITIDSVVLVNADETVALAAEGLPLTLQPGEKYSFTTLFDPEIPDGIHEVSIKVYSDNYKEPVFIFHQNNIANYSASVNIEQTSDNVKRTGYRNYHFGDVSLIDGTREGLFRIWSSNGYGIEIDSIMFQADTAGFSIGDLEAGTIIPSGDTADFSISFAPRNDEGPVYERMRIFYPFYNSGLQSQNEYYYFTGFAVDELSQKASLTVNAGTTVVPHEGMLNFGSIPENGGIKDMNISLKNTGVQFVTIDSILFSDPAFSYLWMSYDENDDEFDEGPGIPLPRVRIPEPEYEETEKIMTVWYNDDGMMTVYFDPETTGAVNATMTIYSDDPDHPEYVVNLAGNGTTGIEDALAARAELYPNPAVDIVTIHTGTSEQATIDIFNAAGSFVYQTLINNSGNIDVTGFESGVYIVKIRVKEQSTFLRLVVQ